MAKYNRRRDGYGMEAQIVRDLEALGNRVFKIESAKYRGYPDLIIVTRFGETIYAEIKAPTGTLRVEQREVLEDLRGRGAKAIVAKSLDDILTAMSQ